METLAEAEVLLDRLGDAEPGVKIGTQLFTAAGPVAAIATIVEEIRSA